MSASFPQLEAITRVVHRSTGPGTGEFVEELFLEDALGGDVTIPVSVFESTFGVKAGDTLTFAGLSAASAYTGNEQWKAYIDGWKKAGYIS